MDITSLARLPYLDKTILLRGMTTEQSFLNIVPPYFPELKTELKSLLFIHI